MVREYPALVIADVRDLSKNSGDPAYAHPYYLCPASYTPTQWTTHR